MPRLLLVDDNPSIHRIAESLLAPTAIELVCVDSAAEALERIQGGERFDVAMVDTAMPGMDGWTLVERLRALEATARMPIALMAGVLDPVDPQKLERAPIQGFLKKPIELRELADRVQTLITTPVDAPVAVTVEPLATQPISREEAQAALAAFPEYTPTIQLPDEDDLLLLTADDLFPEEAAPLSAPMSAPVMEAPSGDLELEELDLEGLQGLTTEEAEPIHAAAPVFESSLEPTRETPPLPELETLGADELSSLLEADLGVPEVPIVPFHGPEPEAVAIPEPISFDPMEEDEVPLPAVGAFALPPMEAPAAPLLPPTQPELPEAPFVETRETPELPAEPAAAPIVPVVAQAPSPAAVPSGAPLDASSQALVQALLADPQAMAQLTKALVAQLGEAQLKALAWEVLPDLAKKLS